MQYEKSRKENSDEKSVRNISEHRERMRDSGSRKDRRMYDDRHNERSRRDTTGDGYSESDRIRKYTKGDRDLDEDQRRIDIYQMVQRHRDERSRRDDRNDEQLRKKRY